MMELLDAGVNDRECSGVPGAAKTGDDNPSSSIAAGSKVFMRFPSLLLCMIGVCLVATSHSAMRRRSLSSRMIGVPDRSAD